MFRNIFIILLSIAMSSTAHVFLKKGMMPTVTETPPLQGICDHIWVTATNPWILGGMTLHVSALVVWLWALSRVDITFAYPFLAFGYILVSLMAWIWLGEHLSQTRILGMVIIIGGIFILSRGG